MRSRVLRLFWLLLAVSLGPARGAPRKFNIEPHASTVRIHVGKTGIASFAGHEHEVVARSVKGEVTADLEDLPRSSLVLIIDAGSLSVLAEGEPAGDAPKVEQAMKGPDVLDATRFPEISFHSRHVSGKRLSPTSVELTVAGDLSLHGVVKAIPVPLQVEVQEDSLVGTGKVALKQSEFGIEPTTAAGGLVKVEDEVTVTFRIVARAQP